MATHPTPIEPDDILDMPIPDHLSGYELVDGQLVPVTPASREHGRLIVEVAYRLAAYLETTGSKGEVLSDAGFVLGLARDPRRLRGPDVAYLTDETVRKYGGPDEHFARFTPDLAVEIDLHSGRKPGGMQRIKDYLEAGVPLIWVIDSSKRAAVVYRRGGTTTKLSVNDSLDGEDVIPGFSLPLSKLFR